MFFFSDVIGIIGVVLVVLAYFAITMHKMTVQDWRYHALNFAGASLIMVSLWFTWNTASVIIEAVWMAISGWGLWRCVKTR